MRFIVSGDIPTEGPRAGRVKKATLYGPRGGKYDGFVVDVATLDELLSLRGPGQALLVTDADRSVDPGRPTGLELVMGDADDFFPDVW